MKTRSPVSWLVAATVLAVTSTAIAQQTPPDFSKVEIKATRIADDFYTLEGQGGTISVLGVYTDLRAQS
jgi:hypothetical protein